MKSILSRIIRIAERVAAHRLSVFDFDDTLVSSSSSVTVEHGDGEVTLLDSASFAYFKPVDGDKIDFSDFNNVTKPRIIKKNMDALKEASADVGTRAVILTARPKGSASAVKKFMEHLGLKNVEVVALQSSDPMDKARWIEQQTTDGIDEVDFTDDSSRNTKAVETLSGKIKGKVKTVNPPHPKEEDYEGPTMPDTFKSDSPSSAKVDVKEKLDPNRKPDPDGKKEEKPEGVSQSHRTSPWWNKQTPEFQHQYCKDHPESPYCGMSKAARTR